MNGGLQVDQDKDSALPPDRSLWRVGRLLSTRNAAKRHCACEWLRKTGSRSNCRRSPTRHTAVVAIEAGMMHRCTADTHAYRHGQHWCLRRIEHGGSHAVEHRNRFKRCRCVGMAIAGLIRMGMGNEMTVDHVRVHKACVSAVKCCENHQCKYCKPLSTVFRH